MESKKCFKCEEIKGLSSFYKNGGMKDGRVNKCKECTKSDVKANTAKNADYYKEYDRKRANLPHRVAARSLYASTERGKERGRAAKDKWTESNPIKKGASTMVGNAVRDGRLSKGACCESCNSTGKLHGHHDDYAKPLDVRWLCAACHHKWHAANGEGVNAK